MSMNDMLADMLKKAIPQEVLELLSKEQLEAMGEKINAFVIDVRSNFQAIIERQADDHTAIMNELSALREEVLNHVGNNGSVGNSGGSRSRKREQSAE